MRGLPAIAAFVLGALAAAGAQAPSPLSPDAERATFHLADPELVIELAAAEPNLRAPVAVAWDAAGRMFVAEMTDYPSGPVSGRIRMLEDRNGDGIYERATLFATNLAFPNGVMPWKNGILVTAAPDIWFLADTNGDGVADIREKVLTGFTEGNQQLRVNGLFWGIDNWIYGANGRSDGDVRWADDTTAGSIRRRDFRFRPDTKRFEAIAGNSQFGMGHDDFGNRFPVFNNVPIRHVVMEDRYIERQPLLAGADVVPGISPATNGTRVFARTPPALLIPQPVGFFTSACGPSIYRGTTFPAGYQGNAFVCEPVQNVVQRRILVPNDATFIAEYAHTNDEFLAATDPWFHGVFTATGPDGAFYVVDMYREWVEHPHWVAPEIRDKVDWRKGEEHGRIWRIRGRNSSLLPPPDLAPASNVELVNALENANGWTRDTAHRLLIERKAADVLEKLRGLALSRRAAEGRVHALSILAALDDRSVEVIGRLIADPDPRVRERAIAFAADKLAGRDPGLSSLALRLIGRAGVETDARVRLQLACALGDVPDRTARIEALTSLAARSPLDSWQITGLLSSSGDRPWLLVKGLVARQPAPGPDQARLIERFASAIVTATNTDDAHDFLQWLSTWKSPARLPAFAAFAESPRSTSVLKRAGDDAIEPFRAEALAVTTNTEADLPLRLAAIHIIARTARAVSTNLFPALLNFGEAAPVQSTAARLLLDLNDPAVTTPLFARWSSLPKPARQQLLGSAARNATSAAALLHAVSAGSVGLIEVDAVTRQAIQKMQSRDVRAAAEKILAGAISTDREAVVQKYKAALDLNPDRKHGAAVFEKNCTICHQMQGVGAKIGPDLSGIGTQTRESLLVQILDPSRQVLPDFVAYVAETKDGETYTGFVAAENATTVTLRRPNEPDITLRRPDLKELKTTGKSLMPDGLEAAITVQDMADLIEFLRRPDRTLFTDTATTATLNR